MMVSGGTSLQNVHNSGLVKTGQPWTFTYLKYVPGAVTGDDHRECARVDRGGHDRRFHSSRQFLEISSYPARGLPIALAPFGLIASSQVKRGLAKDPPGRQAGASLLLASSNRPVGAAIAAPTEAG
jgi:hypothetical protein